MSEVVPGMSPRLEAEITTWLQQIEEGRIQHLLGEYKAIKKEFHQAYEQAQGNPRHNVQANLNAIRRRGLQTRQELLYAWERAQKNLKNIITGLSMCRGYSRLAVDSTGSVLIATTDPVKIKHNGTVYNFGVYTIEIKEHDHMIAYKVISRKRPEGDFIHPHYKRNDHNCLGTFGPAIEEAVESFDVPSFLVCFRQYLGIYNPSSPMMRIEGFEWARQ